MIDFSNPVTWVILAAIVAVAVFVIYKNSKKEYSDIDLPIPSTRRTDLLYGYYSSLDRTFEQVKDHVNLHWFSHFYPVQQLIQEMKNHNAAFVVDISNYLFEGSGKRGRYFKENAESELRGFFAWLKFEGVLDKITYLYPIDEPNLFCKSEEDHLKALQATKKVMAEFSELAKTELAVMYAGGGYWMNMHLHQVVAVDNYDQKSESLTTGDHADLVSHMQPNQKTFLVPGPGFGHKPDPWIAYALLNPQQVVGVIPFIWFDDPNHKDVPYTGLEAAEESFKQQWVHAGNICLNKA